MTDDVDWPESPDERLTLLLSEADDPNIDVVAWSAEVAWTRLEIAARDDDETQLEQSINLFEEALRMAPLHPDVLWLRFRLGFAYGTRAEWNDDIPDFDRAIEQFRIVYDEVAEDADRDLTALSLLDALLDRFRRHRNLTDCGDFPTVEDVRRLVDDLSAVVLSGQDSTLTISRDLVLGIGHMELYRAASERGDLDVAITLLNSGLQGATAETPRRLHGACELADAYRTRFELDADRASIDLSIDTAEAACSDGATDPDGLTLLHTSLAMSYGTRCVLTESPDDRDRAIANWRVVIGVWPDALWAAECAELLRERAEITGDLGDMDEALRLLKRSVEERDDELLGAYWSQLGLTHFAHWKISASRHHLKAALHCMDVAPAMELEDEFRLAFHAVHMEIANELLRGVLDERAEIKARAVADLRRLAAEGLILFERATDAGVDARTTFAGQLAMHQLFCNGSSYHELDVNRVRDLLILGAQAQPDEPQWQLAMEYGLGVLDVYIALARGDGAGDADWGLERLLHASQPGVFDEGLRASIDLVVSMVSFARAGNRGDLRAITAARRSPRLRTPPGADDPQRSLTQAAMTMMTLSDMDEWGDRTAYRADVDLALATTAADPASERGDQTFNRLISAMRATIQLRGDDPDAVRQFSLPELPHVESEPSETFVAALTAMVVTSQAERREDTAELRAAAAYFERLAALTPDRHPARAVTSHGAGLAYLILARSDPTDVGTARLALRWSEEAAALAGGPRHALWKYLAMNVAESGRLSRDVDLRTTRQQGQSALRAHAWHVLLQSGTDEAIGAARDAASTAEKVAAWCREDGAYEDLVAVLDSARALVLQAATTSQSIAELLVAAGQRGLAAEWTSTDGRGRDEVTGEQLSPRIDGAEVPNDLRRRVLRELRADQPGTQLAALEPITTAEIGAALHARGTDALVYLVPVNEHGSGAAVVVTADGAVELIDLPDLRTDVGSTVGGLVATRDLESTGTTDEPQDIDALCRFAWRAAMERLVAYAEGWHLQRPARLTLVPMGALAAVPWHGAYLPDGDSDGRRYAIHDLVISYSVSARMFCQVAGSTDESIGAALVIGNPGGDLPYAGLEAQAIHQQFYPSGTYFGQPDAYATGRATPSEILDWISAASGPTVLHFACHGRADPERPADTHLVLADGATLPARRLLDAARSAALPIDRVFLAACTTHRVGSDYDEAFSLASVFLAAGARTVFGSLWPVPDVNTSLLMFMVHHFLNADGRAPADALHEAQLWMLDPNRKPPAGMAAPLADLCAGDGPADPRTWAAFTHLGR